MPEIPFKKYLTRKIVLAAVGGRQALELAEREKTLIRHYPCGMKQARYLRAELMQLLDTILRAS